MPPKTTELPGSNRRAQRRADILRAATQLFAQHGYSECDMDGLAGELGVAKGTLYLYFPGKQELFYACVDQGMQDLQRTLDSATAADDDPFRRIARGIWVFLEFFDQHPEHIELLIQERAIFRDRPRPTFYEYRSARKERWTAVYRDLVEQRRLRDDVPVERMMETVGNVLYGTIFTNYFEGRSTPLCNQFDAIVEVIFRGMLSTAEKTQVGEGSLVSKWMSNAAECASNGEGQNSGSS